MAQIGDVISATLIAASDVTDIVGAAASARVFPNHVEQGVKYPAITYDITNTLPNISKTEVSKTDVYAIDVHFYGSKYRILTDLADKARVALDDLNGTIEGVDIDHGIWVGRQEQPRQGDGDQFLYHIIDEYSIRVRN